MNKVSKRQNNNPHTSITTQFIHAAVHGNSQTLTSAISNATDTVTVNNIELYGLI